MIFNNITNEQIALEQLVFDSEYEVAIERAQGDNILERIWNAIRGMFLRIFDQIYAFFMKIWAFITRTAYVDEHGYDRRKALWETIPSKDKEQIIDNAIKASKPVLKISNAALPIVVQNGNALHDMVSRLESRVSLYSDDARNIISSAVSHPEEYIKVANNIQYNDVDYTEELNDGLTGWIFKISAETAKEYNAKVDEHLKDQQARYKKKIDNAKEFINNFISSKSYHHDNWKSANDNEAKHRIIVNTNGHEDYNETNAKTADTEKNAALANKKLVEAIQKRLMAYQKDQTNIINLYGRAAANIKKAITEEAKKRNTRERTDEETIQHRRDRYRDF